MNGGQTVAVIPSVIKCFAFPQGSDDLAEPNSQITSNMAASALRHMSVILEND